MVVRVGPTTDGGYGGPRSRSIDAQFKSKGGKEKYALEGLKLIAIILSHAKVKCSLHVESLR